MSKEPSPPPNVYHPNFCIGCGEIIDSKLFNEHYRRCWLESEEPGPENIANPSFNPDNCWG